MRWLDRLRGRDRELQDELEAHLRMDVTDRMARGASRADAEAAAKREFGNSLLVTETVRDVWGRTWLESLWGDMRYGWRSLWSRPGFAAMATLALALGIGAATTMFSVLYGVLIDPFPYKDADRLVLLSVFDLDRSSEMGRRRIVTRDEAREFSGLTDIFEGFANSDPENGVLNRGGLDYPVQVISVGGEVFPFIGIRTMLGRGIQPHDAEPGSPPVAVLSENAWRKFFAADPAVVNQNIMLNQQVRTVIGVAPKRFAWFTGDFWIPGENGFVTPTNPGGLRYMQARVRPGVPIARVNAELTAVGKRLRAANPGQYPKNIQVRGIYCIDDLVGPPFRLTLYMLSGAVFMLLLIACSNVANMLLSRATARYREIGVRMALGAGRMRIVRQLLVEALLLAAGGAAMGSAIAYGGVRALQLVLPPNTFAPESVVALNVPVLLFAVGLSIFTVLLFGLAPAWQVARRNRVEWLRGVSKAAGEVSRTNWLRDIFVGAQVAMSLILMVGATLLMRSFAGVFLADTGVDAKSVAIAFPFFQQNAYSDRGRLRQLMDEAEIQVRSLPGVRSVAQATGTPILNGGASAEVRLVSRGAEQGVSVMASGDSTGLLDVAGYRITQGRWLTDADVAGERNVAVINETLARRLNIANSPVGAAVALHIGNDPTRYEIVGVLKDAPNHGLRLPVEPAIHVPVTTFPFSPGQLVIRAQGHANGLLDPLWRELQRTLPNTRFIYLKTLDTLLEPELGAHRFALALLGTFAVTGLALALIGLYAVMSYAVARRSYEVGIRMALGARAQQVVQLLATRGAVIVAIGIVAGTAGSAAATRVLASYLGPVSTHDPLSYGGVIAALALTAMVAIIVPATRALGIDPARALRHE
jgi:putative ABC transport system permease protein